ncbi:MAG: cyclase family protein [Dehalococcoidales bacterium]|nr:cyclase family protein [Dehalococcoidales bacterium]
MKIYDLSLPLGPNASERGAIEIVYHDHAQGAVTMRTSFQCDRDDLPAGLGWAVETATLPTHAGTHVDAPWHYTPVCEGKKARTIDQMPLEWFYGDGVVLDMRHKPQGSGITVDDLKKALKKIDYKLKACDIVFIQTGTDKYWGKKEYFDAGCGMTRESTLWLIRQGIRVVGTDAWGWDRPFWAIREEFRKTGDKSILWGAHYAGIEKEYCHIEKLANLDKLPSPFGFKVACFPVKLLNASAGWVRVAAIFED